MCEESPAVKEESVVKCWSEKNNDESRLESRLATQLSWLVEFAELSRSAELGGREDTTHSDESKS